MSRDDQRGQVAGVEGLAFGVLVFVFGLLIVVHGWAVVDARLATSAAAREATRVFVEAPGAAGEADADRRAVDAGRRALLGYGRRADRAAVARVAGRLARCSRVTYEAAYRLPLVRVPVVGGWGAGVRVTSRHSEVVDPHRSGLGGDGDCTSQ